MNIGILSGNDNGHARHMGTGIAYSDHLRSSDDLEPSLNSDSLHSNRGHQSNKRSQSMPVNAASLMNAPYLVYIINEQPESYYLQPYN